MTEKKYLTRAEHQVMLILWDLEGKGGFTNDILQGFENPKPAYTTLATFMKILTNKGFVNAEKIGSMLYYTPKISKATYCKRMMEKACNDYFGGNTAEFLKFVIKNTKYTEDQKEAIASMLA